MLIRNICVTLLLASVAGCLESVEEAKNIRLIETNQPTVQNSYFTDVNKEVKSGHVIITTKAANQSEIHTFILTNQDNYLKKPYLDNPTAKDPDSIILTENLQLTTEFKNEELPFASYGNYYTGNTVSNGKTLTYNIYKDSKSKASLVAEFQERDMPEIQKVDFYYLQVGGDKFSGSMPDGEHTYKGANFVTNAGNIKIGESRFLYPGTFNMTINFDTRIGNITTTSKSNHKITNGDILVHSENGKFSGPINMVDETLPSDDDRRKSTGTITGSLHGNGGVGVSGNYYVRNITGMPTLIGSIVGARTHE